MGFYVETPQIGKKRILILERFEVDNQAMYTFLGHSRMHYSALVINGKVEYCSCAAIKYSKSCYHVERLQELEDAHKTGSAIIAPIEYHDNVWENGLNYGRVGGKRVDMVVTHLPGSEAHFSIGVYKLIGNPNLNPSQLVEITMEEARLLRDLLCRPEVQKYLEEEY